jgi:hypothetical protein
MRTRLVMLMLVAVVVGRPAGVGAAEADTERRLRVLEQALHEAQREIQRLREEVRRQKAEGEATRTQVEESRKADVEQAKQAEESKKQVEEVKKTASLPDWVRRFTPFGDVRLRFEGFYNQPGDVGEPPTPSRNRVRLRARIGARVALVEELSAAIRLATGNPDDPISTNVTLGEDFTPKDINLDWAYLTFTPGKTFDIRPGLVSITGGKFPNPIFKPDEMVWDEDLSPEGFYQTLAMLDKPLGSLDQLKLHLLQWTFHEVSDEPDGWMIGGQVNPIMHLGAVQIEAGVGQYYYINPNLIAQDLNTNSSLKNTNLVVTEVNSDGDTEIVAFQSGFNLTGLSLAVVLPDVVDGMPLRFFGDFVHNWQAVSDPANGVTAGIKLGNPKKRGDWAATALYEFLGQEAALSTFTWSDFGQGGTNQQGPVAQLEYQLLDPITLSVRNYFTNYINNPVGKTNPTLFRLQLDATARF